jgi:acylphosphatase
VVTHHLHLRVLGRVQGVGFRYFVLACARALELRGTVRNHRDGSVEIEAEGERSDLERLLAEVRTGPRLARVTHVEETWAEGPPRRNTFDVSG